MGWGGLVLLGLVLVWAWRDGRGKAKRRETGGGGSFRVLFSFLAASFGSEYRWEGGFLVSFLYSFFIGFIGITWVFLMD